MEGEFCFLYANNVGVLFPDVFLKFCVFVLDAVNVELYEGELVFVGVFVCLCAFVGGCCSGWCVVGAVCSCIGGFPVLCAGPVRGVLLCFDC